MRSRAGSWSLAFVLVLSVLLILGSSNAGFLALAQSDSTPVVEEPAQDEPPPVEVSTDTPAPEPPTEIPPPPTVIPPPPTNVPIPPTETPIPATELPVPPTETPISDTPVTNDAMVEAAAVIGIPINVSACWQHSFNWTVILKLDQPAFPTGLTLEFASGATTSVYPILDYTQGSDGYRQTYMTLDNLGEQLVSVSGAVSTSLNPVAYLEFGPNCSLAVPTATPIPTVTPTPTLAGTTTLVSSFADCSINSAMWFFRLSTQGSLPAGASWPSTVHLTFASGATGTATTYSETIGESAAQFEYRSFDYLDDALVSATLALPPGLTGVLELRYAPTCAPGVPATATATASSTATATPTATWAGGSTTISPDIGGCVYEPSGWTYFLMISAPSEVVQGLSLPATIRYGTGEMELEWPSSSSTQVSQSTPGYEIYQAIYQLPPVTLMPFTLTVDVPAAFSQDRLFQLWSGPACVTDPSPTPIPTSTPVLASYSATFDDCGTSSVWWRFRLAYPGPLSALPETVSVTFSSGDVVTVNLADTDTQNGKAIGWYIHYGNPLDHVVSATALAPPSDQVTFQVYSAGSCIQGVPGQPLSTLTPIPTITNTPTATNTRTAIPTTLIGADFRTCQIDATRWDFQLFLAADPYRVPASITLTFANGETATASGEVFYTEPGFGSFASYSWYGNLSDVLASATAEVYTGTTGNLIVTWAPNCQQGVLDGPTETPVPPTETPTETITSTSTITATQVPTETATEVPTATASSTPTEVATETETATSTPVSATYTAGFDYCVGSTSGWFWILDFRGTVEQVPESIFVTFASGATETVQATYREPAGTLVSGWYPSTNHLSDHVVSATAEAPSGVSVWFELTQGPSCQPGMPGDATSTATPTSSATATVTDTPTVTSTPTVPGTTEMMAADFTYCQPESWWYFQMFIEADASWLPSSITLTFTNGETVIVAQQGDYSVAGIGSWAYFNWYQNLSDALVSATAEVYAGTIGTLDLVWAPNCQQGVLDVATETPDPPTATDPATETLTPSITPSATPTETATATSTPTTTIVTVTPTQTATPTDEPTLISTPSPSPTALPSDTATATSTETSTSSPTATETPTATATATVTESSTPTEAATETSTSTQTAPASNTPSAISSSTATGTPTVTAMPTWSGITKALWATFDECNPNPEIWYFRLTVQGTLPGGATWPANVELSFSSGATAVASKIDQVIGENFTQLWFSTNGNLDDALVSGTVELPSELNGLLELLYAPNCTQGVPVTATSIPTETMTASATATATPSPTSTATLTPTATATPSNTATEVSTETATASSTPTSVPTETATETETTTPTTTSSATATSTPSETPTESPTPTATASPTETPSSTATASGTSTSSATTTATSTSSSTSTSTATVTATATSTPTSTSSPTTSNTASATPSNTVVPALRTTANVNCRVDLSTSATSLGVVPRGTVLAVRGPDSGNWTPVICFGQNGWVSRSYLVLDPVATAPVTPGVTMTATTRVNCRTGASTGSAIIGVVPARTALTLRGALQAGWYPVVCFGQNGWISASYLAPDPTATATPPSGPQAVTTTRVNCRTTPTTSQSNVITVLNGGVSVPVRAAAAGGWTPVVCGGQDGWISSQYLRP